MGGKNNFFNKIVSMGLGQQQLPKQENPEAQRQQAEAEAKARTLKEIGEKGKGLSSTMLGGSVDEDSSVLRKKKLLGE
jgi:hypothetical protein